METTGIMGKIKSQVKGKIRTIKELQEMNCFGCKFADKTKVRTGSPCCRFPGKIKVGSEGICLSKRVEK